MNDEIKQLQKELKKEKWLAKAVAAEVEHCCIIGASVFPFPLMREGLLAHYVED